MNKEELINECNTLLDKIHDPSEWIYGAGEFLEGTVRDLVPYLNKEGLKFLVDELKTLLSK